MSTTWLFIIVKSALVAIRHKKMCISTTFKTKLLVLQYDFTSHLHFSLELIYGALENF